MGSDRDSGGSLARTALATATAVPLTITMATTGVIACRLGHVRDISRVWVGRGLFNPVLLAAAGVRVEVRGQDELVPGEPVLLVSNHQSLFDIPALVVALPFAFTFIAKAQLFRVPLFGRYLTRSGHVPIVRAIDREAGEPGDSRAGERMIDEVVARLDNGDSMAIFPEGTRTRDGDVRSFRSGFVRIARRAGVRVVPIGISGSMAVMPRASRLLHPGTIRVAIGAPLALGELGDPLEDVRERVIGLHREACVGGPAFAQVPGPVRAALGCRDRFFPGSLARPNPMRELLQPGPDGPRIVFFCPPSPKNDVPHPGAVSLAARHRELGDTVVAVVEEARSAWGRALAPALTIAASPADRRARAQALADARGVRLSACICYAGAPDNGSLLEVVGHPVALASGRRARAMAQRRGWPIVHLAKGPGPH